MKELPSPTLNILICNNFKYIVTKIQDKAISFKNEDFTSITVHRQLVKLHKFNFIFIYSHMEEMSYPTLNMLINIISKHIETIIHEKCNFL